MSSLLDLHHLSKILCPYVLHRIYELSLCDTVTYKLKHKLCEELTYEKPRFRDPHALHTALDALKKDRLTPYRAVIRAALACNFGTLSLSSALMYGVICFDNDDQHLLFQLLEDDDARRLLVDAVRFDWKETTDRKRKYAKNSIDEIFAKQILQRLKRFVEHAVMYALDHEQSAFLRLLLAAWEMECDHYTNIRMHVWLSTKIPVDVGIVIVCHAVEMRWSNAPYLFSSVADVTSFDNAHLRQIQRFVHGIDSYYGGGSSSAATNALLRDVGNRFVGVSPPHPPTGDCTPDPLPTAL